jgi:hypothetical protein
MFIEKKRKGVSPRPLTSDGTTNGVITLADTSDLFVKQIIFLVSNTQQPRELEIKRFINRTTFKVGPKGSNIQSYSDVSDFLVSDGAILSAPEQDRPAITEKEHERAVYAEEPIVAKRSVLVDDFGDYYNTDNRLPVDIGTNISLEGDLAVNLDAVENTVNPDNVFMVGSENGTKNGVRHVARVDSELDLRVGISDGNNKATVNGSGELLVTDSAVALTLSSIATLLTSIDAGIPVSLGQTTMANSMPVTIASDQTAIPVTGPLTDAELRASPIEVTGDLSVVLTDEPIKISGTENGQPNGPEFPFVNNLVQQILKAKDRTGTISYADFGTKNQRITSLTYTAPSIGVGPGFTAVKTFTYTLVGNRYRRDTPGDWSLV